MWRERIAELTSHATFSAPVDARELADAEAAHESDSRRWAAGSLAQYLQWSLDGTLKI